MPAGSFADNPPNKAWFLYDLYKGYLNEVDARRALPEGEAPAVSLDLFHETWHGRFEDALVRAEDDDPGRQQIMTNCRPFKSLLVTTKRPRPRP